MSSTSNNNPGRAIAYEQNAIGKRRLAVWGIKSCPQGYKTILYFFGKSVSIRNPGIFLVIPFLFETRPVYVGLTSANINPENIVTKDGFRIRVDASIQYKVIDVDKSAHNIIHLHEMLKDNVTTAIRQTFCLLNLEEILSKQVTLSHEIRKQLNNQYAHLQEEIQIGSQNQQQESEIIEHTIQLISENARRYLENYVGIKIGNINLERIHFPPEFTETKIKIQQNNYQQLQLNIENETKVLKQKNEQKLVMINTQTESDRILILADTKKKETITLTEAESLRILKLADTKKDEKIILANAQSKELEILNKAIKENKEAYELKILNLSSDSWKSVAGGSGSKLIISNGDQTTQPLGFINQLSIAKEVFK